MKTVLEATAAGADAIESWPGSVFLDWMGDCLWIFAGLAMSAVPGAASIIATPAAYLCHSFRRFNTTSSSLHSGARRKKR